MRVYEERQANLQRRMDNLQREMNQPEAQEEEKKAQEVTASPTGPNSLYKKKEFSDVAFFRLGYFDYLKLNTQNMLQ